MRTAKVISLSLPPDMEKEVQKIAKEEHRTVSELLREAFRQYLANRDLTAIRNEGRKIAKRMKLKPDDVDKIVRSGRKS
jgi:metal-responsive CopG/Arc/MetJ family transcriptional regulator